MQQILERARQIILKPKETWEIIKGEVHSVQELFVNYAAPLVLIPALANLIGLTLIGIRVPSGNLARAPFMEAVAGGIIGYFFHLLGLLAGAWAISYLAPYFESKPDFNAAVKLIVYSMTPIWLVGVLSIFPGIGILQMVGLYGVYLLYLGLPILLGTPPDKALRFTILIMVSAGLISLVLTVLVGGAVYGPMFLRMMAK